MLFRSPISFFEEHAKEDVYVRSLFKSFADLFYSKKQPTMNPQSESTDWLLHGQIDKPAFFVTRSTQKEPFEKDTAAHLVKLEEEYGFIYYRRDVPAGK